MTIPEIDQQLASVKSMDTQFSDGYHVREQDYIDYIDAMAHIIYLYNVVQQKRRKEGKEVRRAQ